MNYRNQLSPPLFPSSWACEWGEDAYGLWQTLNYGGVRQVFRWIEPGIFLMGSPADEAEREWWSGGEGTETQHQVTLTQGFWLADTTVTQAFWLAVLGGDNPSAFQDSQDHPVEQVSWNDVQRFIERLNALAPGLHAQLPSEAQWEYACRAGTTKPFSFGNNISPEQVNYNGDWPYTGGEPGLNRKKTIPVKSLPANPWGLYEMHGNLMEWCRDVWQQDLGAAAVVDPLTQGDADQGGDRVLRGGSWFHDGGSMRSASRGHVAPDNRFSGIGFRLALGHTELRPAAEPE
ncbi:formylglycine-generating enzyme family protein [Methylomonas sp. MV1]|uniref:formylglycine-generating enzyme family protein n=1 Tax=Methylomonas sp. MV1 TaxID=3073620 RepID=UPI0028A3A176|nr:formylglycine-generating enzyme family protein [Methylomonas sp. MV1]MDT4329102.1 formylglycine-generating enzyme family protein [Methylomonas sp. MV1]